VSGRPRAAASRSNAQAGAVTDVPGFGLVVVRPGGYVGPVAEPGDCAAVTSPFAALRP
jgi:hypothetical protein